MVAGVTTRLRDVSNIVELLQEAEAKKAASSGMKRNR
jgi:hypothetical protein